DDSQWHLQAVTKAQSSATRFLAVIQISPNARREDVYEVDEGSSINIQAGDWMISARLDTATEPFFSVTNSSGTRLVYEDARDPVLVEMSGGIEQKQTAAQQVPWHLEQSALQHRHETNTN